MACLHCNQWCYCIVIAIGANLDIANHVIIVHPYCPPHIRSVTSVPLAQAQAFEQQAIGRVLRFPQQKDVFLYRYKVHRVPIR